MNIRILGTKGTTYLSRLRSFEGNILTVDDFPNQKQTYSQFIEFNEVLGTIKPKYDFDRSKKANIAKATFEKTNISEDEIVDYFIRNFDKELYKNTHDLKVSILLANLHSFTENEQDRLNIESDLSKIEKDTSKVADCILPFFNTPNFLDFARSTLGYTTTTISINVSDLIESFDSDKENTLSLKNFKNENTPFADKNPVISKACCITELLEFFKKAGTIKIPVYQRSYCWPEQTVLKLLHDIQKQYSINLNSIVLQRSVSTQLEDTYSVIDGQQRLTTFIIILLGLRKNIFERFSRGLTKNKNLLNLLKLLEQELNKEDYIHTTFKKTHGSIDFQALTSLIENDEPSLIERETQVIKNFSCTCEYLNDLSDADLILFGRKFLVQTYVTLIIDGVSVPLELFENLNTTSIPLTTIDLLKSHLISLIPNNDEMLESHEVSIQEKFEKQINLKFVENPNIKPKQFVMIFLRLNGYKNIKTQSFLSLFKEHFQSQEDVQPIKTITNYIDEIEEILDITIGIRSKTIMPVCYGLQIDDFLHTLKRDVYYPFIIHFILKFKDKTYSSNEVRDLLLELEAFEYILQVLAYRGQSLSSTLDDVLSKVVAFESTSKLTPIEFNKILNENAFISKTLNSDKNSFINQVIDTQPSINICQGILTRVKCHLYNNNSNVIKPGDSLPIVANSSVEHIMPKNGNRWFKEKSVSKAKHVEFVDHIGNLLILDQKLNSTISNKVFSEKIEIIRTYTHLQSDYTFCTPVTNVPSFDVYNLESWTIADIKKRGDLIAHIAADIWFK